MLIQRLPNGGSKVQGPALSLSESSKVRSQIRTGNFHISRIFGSKFASENEALMVKNTIPWQKNVEMLRLIKLHP